MAEGTTTFVAKSGGFRLVRKPASRGVDPNTGQPIATRGISYQFNDDGFLTISNDDTDGLEWLRAHDKYGSVFVDQGDADGVMRPTISEVVGEIVRAASANRRTQLELIRRREETTHNRAVVLEALDEAERNVDAAQIRGRADERIGEEGLAELGPIEPERLENERVHRQAEKEAAGATGNVGVDGLEQPPEAWPQTEAELAAGGGAFAPNRHELATASEIAENAAEEETPEGYEEGDGSGPVVPDLDEVKEVGIPEDPEPEARETPDDADNEGDKTGPIEPSAEEIADQIGDGLDERAQAAQDDDEIDQLKGEDLERAVREADIPGRSEMTADEKRAALRQQNG